MPCPRLNPQTGIWQRFRNSAGRRHVHRILFAAEYRGWRDNVSKLAAEIELPKHVHGREQAALSKQLAIFRGEGRDLGIVADALFADGDQRFSGSKLQIVI